MSKALRNLQARLKAFGSGDISSTTELWTQVQDDLYWATQDQLDEAEAELLCTV